jgi:hypothetical protein
MERYKCNISTSPVQEFPVPNEQKIYKTLSHPRKAAHLLSVLMGPTHLLLVAVGGANTVGLASLAWFGLGCFTLGKVGLG